MKHNLFKPQSFEEGRHGVVGNCNGISMDVRYKEETPLFVKKILENTPLRKGSLILDYGCGVGRLSKEMIRQDSEVNVIGVDPSREMQQFAEKDINSERFSAYDPHMLADPCIFDTAVLVYVLQHIPAIEIREALQRIHYTLKDDGFLVYCSSDYRMAIRFDDGGFFDDRFLGVNLWEELNRFFEMEKSLFTDSELESNKVVKQMVTGGTDGLPHPALVFRKRKIDGPLFNATYKEIKEKVRIELTDPGEKEELVLVQKQSPGDIMMATIALRDLHTAYPGKYATDMRTPCNEIFQNSPYITPIQPLENENDIIADLKSDPNHPPIVKENRTYCNLHYPMVHQSGQLGTHFADSMTDFLSKQLGIEIPRTGLRPEIYLDQNEQLWPSPVVSQGEYTGDYWVINAGCKSDFPLKQYPFYQQVVDLLKDEVKFVQIGVKSHNHPKLRGVIDMVGKTRILREFFRVIAHSQGVLTCVSLSMHTAAAFSKPCVVVAGGREGTRWELYPDHRFLYVNGALDCCQYDGCWKSRIEECLHPVKYDFGKTQIPLCMELITPEQIADSIRMYYKGGILKTKELVI